MHANEPRGVALYNSLGKRFLKTLKPVQVRRCIYLQLNDTTMLNGALEKLEHLRQGIMHEFGTDLGKTWQKKFLGSTLVIVDTDM